MVEGSSILLHSYTQGAETMAHKGFPMSKRQFRIGELSEALQVERYIIRFWEKEFNINGYRSPGGQRFYTVDDLASFINIKELLYQKGYTITGARLQLEMQKKVAATPLRQTIAPARKALQTLCDECRKNQTIKQELEMLAQQVQTLQKQLIQFQKQS